MSLLQIITESKKEKSLLEDYGSQIYPFMCDGS